MGVARVRDAGFAGRGVVADVEAGRQLDPGFLRAHVEFSENGVRFQVLAGQSLGGDAQSAHRRGRRYPVSHHVTHDERHLAARQLDRVVPVASDLADVAAGQVPVCGPYIRAYREGGGEQGALECERDVLDAAVEAGVVQTERGAGGELMRPG